MPLPDHNYLNKKADLLMYILEHWPFKESFFMAIFHPIQISKGAICGKCTVFDNTYLIKRLCSFSRCSNVFYSIVWWLAFQSYLFNLQLFMIKFFIYLFPTVEYQNHKWLKIQDVARFASSFALSGAHDCSFAHMCTPFSSSRWRMNDV